jgi:hypothetical protein
VNLRNGRVGHERTRLFRIWLARADEKVRELTPRNLVQSLKDCIKQVNAYLLGWIGCFWICADGKRERCKTS